MKMTSDFDQVFEMFDRIFADTGVTSRELFQGIYTAPSYPPCNISIGDNKEMVFEFAIAGIDPDRVSVEFNNDNLLFKIAPVAEDKTGKKYIHRGIKLSAVQSKYLVPASKYKHADVSAKVKDGILTVVIPADPEKEPKKVEIVKE